MEKAEDPNWRAFWSPRPSPLSGRRRCQVSPGAPGRLRRECAAPGAPAPAPRCSGPRRAPAGTCWAPGSRGQETVQLPQLRGPVGGERSGGHRPQGPIGCEQHPPRKEGELGQGCRSRARPKATPCSEELGLQAHEQNCPWPLGRGAFIWESTGPSERSSGHGVASTVGKVMSAHAGDRCWPSGHSPSDFQFETVQKILAVRKHMN